jgi:AP-2 complex subunit mu-1
MKVVTAKNFNSPVLLLDRSSFMFIRSNDLIIAAATKKNAHANLVFQFLYQLVDVFSSYFDGEFTEDKIRSNFVLIYELFDEVMDHGYPQIVDPALLQKFIQHGSAKDLKISALEKARQDGEILQEVTGSTPWRQPGKYMYQKNEVYLDVVESVNVIVNQQNKVLSASCLGKIVMKSNLSGMPICRFGLNDKVAMQTRRKARGSKRKVSSKAGIALQDVTFHQCVRLNRYDQDKTIMFIPPDGDYELMTYRIDRTNLPFDVTGMVQERGRNRVEYHVKVRARYEPFNHAENIVVHVPVPQHTASVNIKCTHGKCEYMPTKNTIEWKISKLAGGQSIILKGDVKLIHLIQDKAWSRPPITMCFTIAMWPASGIKVRFLNVQEPKMNYKSIKWVRYITHAGDYQIRI